MFHWYASDVLYKPESSSRAPIPRKTSRSTLGSTFLNVTWSISFAKPRCYPGIMLAGRVEHACLCVSAFLAGFTILHLNLFTAHEDQHATL